MNEPFSEKTVRQSLQQFCQPEPSDERPPSPAPDYSIAYQAATPYPAVRAAQKNPQYAAAMLDNMSGPNSEMSAIGLYFYDHLLSSGYGEVSEAFHRISIVEMHHMEIFAELAMLLGENPRLWSHQGRSGRYMFWNASCLRYPPVQPASGSCIPAPSLRLLLAQAIESEQDTIKKYMNQITWIQDVNICDILRRISADEQMHVDILTRLYHKF